MKSHLQIGRVGQSSLSGDAGKILFCFCRSVDMDFVVVPLKSDVFYDSRLACQAALGAEGKMVSSSAIVVVVVVVVGDGYDMTRTTVVIGRCVCCMKVWKNQL